MEEYLIKVGKAAKKDFARWLDLPESPEHVRIATLAPLSAYGYPEGSEGALLGINEHGLITGAEGRSDIPRDFVPWSNVSYVSDGDQLAREQKEAKK